MRTLDSPKMLKLQMNSSPAVVRAGSIVGVCAIVFDTGDDRYGRPSHAFAGLGLIILGAVFWTKSEFRTFTGSERGLLFGLSIDGAAQPWHLYT